jgi:hypothetical protein
MKLTDSAEINDKLMDHLLLKYPDVKWSLRTRFNILRWEYEVTVKWQDGPCFDDLMVVLKEVKKTLPTDKHVYVTPVRDYSTEVLLGEARAVAKNEWILHHINRINIRYIEVRGVTLERFARDNLHFKTIRGAKVVAHRNLYIT